MTQPITKELYRAASEAKVVLTPAIEALKTIKMPHIFDDAKTAERINQIDCELQAFLNSWEDIIQRGDQAYQNRPESLIQAACNRLLNDIPRLINLEQKTLKHRIDAYRVKSEELYKKGLGMPEINHLCPPVTQEEIDASKVKVTALQDESNALKAFLADAPRYDVGLLENTALKPLIAQDKAAA